MNIHRRTIIGALTAPLAVMLPTSIWEAFNGNDLTLNLIVIPFAYVLAFMLGIPMLLLLNKFRIYSLWKYCLAGALAGALSPVVLYAIFASPAEYYPPHDFHFYFQLFTGDDALVGGMLGAIVAMAYWAIALWRKPVDSELI